MKRGLFVIIVALLVFPVYAQLNPPTGTQYFDLYASPLLLGSYHSTVTYQGPLSLAANPAFLASTKTPETEINYIGLIGGGTTASASGYKGHVLNVGTLIPNSVGVLGLRIRGFYSSLGTSSLGAGVVIGAGMSKQVLPDLSVGASLKWALAGQLAGSTYASGTAGIDWALSGSFGFIHYPPQAKMKNLRWGAALTDAGKGLGTGSGFDYTDETNNPVRVSAYPPIFTLTTGIAGTFIQTESFEWNFGLDFSFPSFQNVKAGLSTNITIGRLFTLSLGTSYDLRELIPTLSPNPRSFIPGVNIELSLPLEFSPERDPFGLARAGLAENTVLPTVAFAPMADDVYSYGVGARVQSGSPDTEAPTVTVEYDELQYISPTGTLESLVAPVEVTDDRYVVAYEFHITDESGRFVWSSESVLRRFMDPDEPFLDRVVYGLGHRYRTISLPREIEWNGLDESGELQPDGQYELYVSVYDDGGNLGSAGPFEFILDSTPPAATISMPDLPSRILSPNNDGNKDTITIGQTGSIEDQWTGEIRRGDFVVRSYSWENAAPASIVWDGYGEVGNVLSDGTYVYALSSTDRAGNTSEFVSEPFVLNNQSTPISLGIDRAYFSPNGDGRQDSISFSLGIPVQDGLVEWTAEILDESGRVRRILRGLRTVPDALIIDGRDNEGKYLPEGSYYGRFSVLYENGNNPAEVSPQFIIDVSHPEAVVTADLSLFSPNGDGNKDEISFFQDTTPEDLWTGVISTRAGAPIYSTTWRGIADRKFTWDGYTENGLLSRNGAYIYTLSSVDKAGNVGTSRPVEFEINYGETAVVLTRKFDSFSPNSDGEMDVQDFSVSLDVEEGIESYELRILDNRDQVIRRITDRAKPSETVSWLGVTDFGGRVPDGTYYAEVTILYANGNRPAARSRSFIVDTRYPEIEVQSDLTLFSPNGDGNRDTVTFTSRSSNEALWNGYIRSIDGRLIRQIFWPGQTSSYVWNGTDEAGNSVADGVYYFEISTTDAAGNKSSARTRNITLDTRLTSIYISVDRARFSPNGDGVDDTVTFNMSTSVRDGVLVWNVDIATTDGEIVRSFTGTRIPERIIWDGQDQSRRLREGEFTVRYTVQYEKGDSPSVVSSSFTVDVSAPDLALLAAPTPFSPDGDGVDDSLVFSINVSDASAIAGWNLLIRDEKDNDFRLFSGTGRPPSRINWNGRSDSGELVSSGGQYRYSMSVTDALGNRSRAAGTILVDILVLEENERLRIRISNLVFESDTASFETASSGVVERNNWILNRVSEILKRLSSYDIRIEGHSTSVYWNDPEQAAVEQDEELVPISKARAETVKTSLARRGVSAQRIEAVGIGGAEPLVPYSDEENSWKNQRIEIILER